MRGCRQDCAADKCKTQVFPLEPNDSVRTRLTHSLEVSSLARGGRGRVAQPFGFRPHRSERAAFPHSAPPEGYPTLARETSRE